MDNEQINRPGSEKFVRPLLAAPQQGITRPSRSIGARPGRSDPLAYPHPSGPNPLKTHLIQFCSESPATRHSPLATAYFYSLHTRQSFFPNSLKIKDGVNFYSLQNRAFLKKRRTSDQDVRPDPVGATSTPLRCEPRLCRGASPLPNQRPFVLSGATRLAARGKVEGCAAETSLTKEPKGLSPLVTRQLLIITHHSKFSFTTLTRRPLR